MDAFIYCEKSVVFQTHEKLYIYCFSIYENYIFRHLDPKMRHWRYFKYSSSKICRDSFYKPICFWWECQIPIIIELPSILYSFHLAISLDMLLNWYYRRHDERYYNRMFYHKNSGLRRTLSAKEYVISKTWKNFTIFKQKACISSNKGLSETKIRLCTPLNFNNFVNTHTLSAIYSFLNTL